jgi:bifunctional UDP-N-acetylglucosamine pyrophosphorylase/glucosamine-1-phosphate N-acetyltransferase
MPDIHVVVLAAGKGTRMKSAQPKVLHRVAGTPMIDYVLDTAGHLDPRSTTVVVGHEADTLRGALASRRNVAFVVQEPQLGTAHALLATQASLADRTGTLVLLSGDVPLLSASSLESLVDRHARSGAAATLLTAVLDSPAGYGRIVRSGEEVVRIVEDRDATPSEREIREVNAGIYAFALKGLFEALHRISPRNAQNELYLTDIVSIYRQTGRRVDAVVASNAEETMGVNSRAELAQVGRTVREARNQALMAAGVTLEDPSTTYIDRDVVVGPDTVIHPGVSLAGHTRVGARCVLHSGVRIVDSRIGDDVTVNNHCVITNCSIEAGASVGPFAHLRNEASVGAGARVGNFVEMKKTALGAGSKAMHLTYLGDAVIGTDVNVGAGTITCNYDGVEKHQTTIESGAFIGSDTQLIAPVTVGRDAYVGTGTTVREDVPPGALAVSAGKQRNIPGWVEEKRKKRKASG